jgi:hypothetical protein
MVLRQKRSGWLVAAGCLALTACDLDIEDPSVSLDASVQGDAPPDSPDASPSADAQPEPRFFKVLAFYNGTYDAAHIAFVHEALPWFEQKADEYGFSFTSTNDWSQLSTDNLSQYQVVMFLDDHAPDAQHAAFEDYMRHGGAWFGFHVAAFNTDPSSWSWYHNDFLGTGAFKSNTWGPTAAMLDVESTHPATLHLPSSYMSAVSEWYSWNNDLRTNPDIEILASIDPASFPLGTDPNQSWYDGYYPIMWTNRKYRMLYANFGHNAMDYGANVQTSSTFDSEMQNRFIIDGLLWLGGSIDPSAGH